MDQERYDLMAKKAAYEVKKAIDSFGNESPEIQKRAQRIIMERVNRMFNGENIVIEGAGLVTRIED